MNFKEGLQKLSIQVMERKNHINNEEMTKQALLIPFLQVLGFDVFNPLETKSEYDADFGKKKGEKVDYAIFKDDIPIMFIEAKAVNENLENHNNQLARYFNSTPEVKLAILTNGVEYKFFTDLDSNNIMDNEPFLQINMINLLNNDIEVLSKFRKETFETDDILKYAEELIYTSNLNKKLREIFKNPPDDFIRYLIKDFSDTRITSNVIERFRPIVKKSISNALLDIVSQGLFQQENSELLEETEENNIELENNNLTNKLKKTIITTEEELNGYNIIKQILIEAGKDISELNYKDTINYFNILLNSNWILRFNFDSKKKHIITKILEEKVKLLISDYKTEKILKSKEGSKIYIDDINDLNNLKDLIIKCYENIF